MAAAALLSTPAAAQTTRAEASVSTELNWTDNAGLVSSTGARDDTIFSLTGGYAIRRTGPRLSLNGAVGFTAVEYLDNTERDRVLPRANLNALFEAVDDFLFIDTGVLVTQTPQDVFGVRADGASTVNKVTTSQYRLSPYVRGELPFELRYQLRSDNTWTDSAQSTATIDNGYTGRHSLRIDRAPLPLGGFLSFDSTSTKYRNDAEPALRDDIARLGLSLAVTPQLSLGVRGGYERAEGVIQQVDESIYGAQIDWRPTQRTSLAGFYEDRFFGDSWQLRFTHRMPRLAWDLNTSRDISTFPELLLRLPATGDLAALIDAALTTRVPDADQRAAAVRGFLNSTGLPNALAGPTNLYSERVLVVTRVAGTVSLIGVRNTLALTAYRSENRDLASEVVSLIVPDPTFRSNNRQSGIGLAYNLRLSATTALTLAGDWSRIRGLEGLSTEESEQQTARLQVSRQLGPKTSVVFGVRYLNFDSNVSTDARENAAFVGLGHRF